MICITNMYIYMLYIIILYYNLGCYPLTVRVAIKKDHFCANGASHVPKRLQPKVTELLTFVGHGHPAHPLAPHAPVKEL